MAETSGWRGRHLSAALQSLSKPSFHLQHPQNTANLFQTGISMRDPHRHPLCGFSLPVTQHPLTPATENVTQNWDSFYCKWQLDPKWHCYQSPFSSFAAFCSFHLPFTLSSPLSTPRMFYPALTGYCVWTERKAELCNTRGHLAACTECYIISLSSAISVQDRFQQYLSSIFTIFLRLYTSFRVWHFQTAQ